jgi:hypothetical protein
MDSYKTLGRIVGALFLAKLIAGPLENFTLMGPVVAEPGFLVNAAAHPLNLPLAVMLAFALCLISLATAVVTWPVFRKEAPQLALWFFALTLIGITTNLVETMTMMSMQSLSLTAAAANGATPELYEALRQVVGKARNWAHYTNLLVGGFGLFVMFLLLYRTRLVPRAIAAFGMATSLLQMYSIGQPFFGGKVDFNLLMPTGLALLALMVWLLWRGFAERAPA